MFRVIGLLSIAILLAGCSSRYPEVLNQPVSTNATVSDVQQGLATDKGVTVRWGGVITNVNNQAKQTWLEVVQLPLRSNGRPKDTDSNSGRFLVKVEGFLDPAIYAKGREFTVVGVLSGLSDGKVGEFNYKFPVVAAQGYHLWPQIRKSDYYSAYFIPVSYWRPYLPYYYPIHYYRSHPRIIRSRSPVPRVDPKPRTNSEPKIVAPRQRPTRATPPNRESHRAVPRRSERPSSSKRNKF